MEATFKKKNGGKRVGAGRPMGAKSKRRLSHISTIEKAIEYFQQRTFGVVDKIFNAQMIVAQGSHKMLRMHLKNGVVETETIRDMDKMQELLDTGEYGKDYVIVVGELPDFRAGDAILNRGLGKPTETLNIGNKDAQPFIIINK